MKVAHAVHTVGGWVWVGRLTIHSMVVVQCVATLVHVTSSVPSSIYQYTVEDNWYIVYVVCIAIHDTSMQGSPKKGGCNEKWSSVLLKDQKISAFFIPHQREASNS